MDKGWKKKKMIVARYDGVDQVIIGHLSGFIIFEIFFAMYVVIKSILFMHEEEFPEIMRSMLSDLFINDVKVIESIYAFKSKLLNLH